MTASRRDVLEPGKAVALIGTVGSRQKFVRVLNGGAALERATAQKRPLGPVRPFTAPTALDSCVRTCHARRASSRRTPTRAGKSERRSGTPKPERSQDNETPPDGVRRPVRRCPVRLDESRRSSSEPRNRGRRRHHRPRPGGGECGWPHRAVRLSWSLLQALSAVCGNEPEMK